MGCFFHKLSPASILVLLAALFMGGNAFAIEREEALKTLESLESAFVYLAEQVRPAVVSLSPYVPPSISQKLSTYERAKPNNSASGVIIDGEKGYIVTNSHAVRDVDGVEVKLLTGEKFIGTVVGHDDDTDLAVVQIETKIPLPAASLGDSSKIKVGQLVVAVGNPYGLSDTLTSGIISGLNRENVNLSRYEDFIQTDASINPGNSGGPLLNVRGEIIGINTAIINYAQNIGFAIPSNIVKGIISQLIEHGEVKRGWLGVGLESVAKGNSRKAEAGVFVSSVYEGEPAHRAGIREGDHIVKVAGARVDSANEMIRMIGAVYPGQKITLDIIRNGQPQTLTVELSARKERESLGIPVKMAPLLGFQVKDMGEASERRYPEGKKGVVVLDVAENSIARQSGLLRDDLIYSLNGEDVLSKDWFEKNIKRSHKGKSVSLRIYRGEESLDLVLPLTN